MFVIGGTVDISVQETTKDGRMKNIYPVCGGPWGGNTVDEEFQKCISKLFGGDVLREFKDEYRAEYLAFYRDFELKKRQVKLSSENRVALKLPAQLCDLQEEKSECSIAEIISNSTFSDKIDTRGDKLMFHHSMFKSFFAAALDSITDHVKEIFDDDRCQNLSGILLVGGFAESEMVIETLRTAFPERKFIVPSEAGLSVVKGAVLYGHEPSIISARTCRYTYGTGVSLPFDQTIHPFHKLMVVSGQYLCNNCFSKAFSIGDLVELGDRQRITFFCDYRDLHMQHLRYQDQLFRVLVTKEKDPKFTDEPGVITLGKIVIPRTYEPWPEYFVCNVDMEIAGTEIEVTCELSTGHKQVAKFEFLSE